MNEYGRHQFQWFLCPITDILFINLYTVKSHLQYSCQCLHRFEYNQTHATRIVNRYFGSRSEIFVYRSRSISNYYVQLNL